MAVWQCFGGFFPLSQTVSDCAGEGERDLQFNIVKWLVLARTLRENSIENDSRFPLCLGGLPTANDQTTKRRTDLLYGPA